MIKNFQVLTQLALLGLYCVYVYTNKHERLKFSLDLSYTNVSYGCKAVNSLHYLLEDQIFYGVTSVSK